MDDRDPGREGRIAVGGQPGAPDMLVVPPKERLPVSRGATERRLDRVNLYNRKAKVTAYEALTGTGTVRISFQVVDDQPFAFKPGYFIGIQAKVPRFGVRKSPYCISSPVTDDRTFRLLVRLVPDGPLSLYLAALRVGDVINFRGPMGRSMLPKEGDHELVLLATGVGVGPFFPLVEHLLAEEPDRPVTLFWGLRLPEDVCLVDELDDLARRHPSFRYQISLSQPPDSWTGLRGRLTHSVPPLLETLGDKRFCLVGNGAMIEEMSLALSDLGVSKQLMYQEAYFNGKHQPDPEVLAVIRRRFVASDLFSPHAHREAGLFRPPPRPPHDAVATDARGGE